MTPQARRHRRRPARLIATALLAAAAGVLGTWAGPAQAGVATAEGPADARADTRVDARADGAAEPARWTAAERATLGSMLLSRLPPPPPDPSNAVEARADAAALGERLFHDRRLSRGGDVACATCHLPERDFQDDRALGQGVATGRRRTMPIAPAVHGPWRFWDGRKDSLWAQALGPLEDAAEHGTNRTRLAHQLRAHYRAEYEAVFDAMPALQGLPADAGPLGEPAVQRAWGAMTPAQREAVDRVFANLGKALAAYERTIAVPPSRFDRYVDAVLRDDPAGQHAMTPQEVNGLRLFIGEARCVTCHQGPLLTDHAFHNTGVPPRDPSRPDRGRAAAIGAVQADPFNCLGRHSDAPAAACAELRFIADDDPRMEGAFKTPSLRQVAGRAPYMHAGQLATLDAVVAHYARAPAAAIGTSELRPHRGTHGVRLPIRLTDDAQRALVAFLKTLGGQPAAGVATGPGR